MTKPPFLFDPPPQPAIPIFGSDRLFPIRRIFCVGRNYRAHLAEMGLDPDRDPPFYFTKSAHDYAPTGSTIPYPPGTADYHYEMELVLAIGARAFRISPQDASACVFGYACGLDMTRRDRQLEAREKRQSWDLGKDFEESAVIGAIKPKELAPEIADQRIVLRRNGEIVQDSTLGRLIWSAPEIVSHLSSYYRLAPGDVIFTGTPAGVGPAVSGDILHGEIDGVGEVNAIIDEPFS